MAREIFEVYAKVIDANGTYNTLSGYPKVFDSKNYSDDIAKTRNRAYGEYHDVLGAMYKRDDRKVQIAMILNGTTGYQLEMTCIGDLNPVEEVAEE